MPPSTQSDGKNACSHGAKPPPAQSDDELMFRTDLFAAIQQRLQKPCTVDACASDGGENALLLRYFSPSDSFLSSDLKSTADMLWLHPPI
jgi:hypothetical protein